MKGVQAYFWHFKQQTGSPSGLLFFNSQLTGQQLSEVVWYFYFPRQTILFVPHCCCDGFKPFTVSQDRMLEAAIGFGYR